MSLPEAVIFDLGKVLLEFDYGIAARVLAPWCIISEARLKENIDQSPLLLRYETGLMSTEEFYQAFQRASGCRCGIADFENAIGDIFSPIPPMIALHESIRKAGIPTYIFSNTNALAVRCIRHKFPFFAHFDGYVLSYEHRSMKPDARIYEAVEKMTGKTGASLLYIDDRPENVSAGRERGWQAVLHRAPESTTAAVNATGLEIQSPDFQ
jgi:HAD superfamily hydrolase (TIGR01509 family)